MEPRTIDLPVRRRLGSLVIAAALLVVACSPTPSPSASAPAGPSGSPEASTSGSPSASPDASASSGVAPSATPIPSSVPASISPGGPLASSGELVVVGTDASLSLISTDRRSVLLANADGGQFAFPAWSPDGSRVATLRASSVGSALAVYNATDALAGRPGDPTILLDSATILPFYLSWTPDGKTVSYLADEGQDLWLRLAPADGSAPTDGSGSGTKVATGNPYYYDWVGNDRLFTHVGSGSTATLGEIALDGSAAAPAIRSPGAFRAPVVSRDGKYFGYVSAGAAGDAEVIAAERGGAGAKTMPVFGVAAIAFDPTGDTLAAVGPAGPALPTGVPVGELRLLDPVSGAVRTLLDGTVIASWWSPDGKTIAALRIQPIAASDASPSPAASGSPPAGGSPAPSPSAPPQEVRLFFVDVASGATSSTVVQPSQLFIDQFFPYFDQYALSHRLWAPDSSSFLMPEADPSGVMHVSVIPRDGGAASTIDGAFAFWSP